MRLGDQRRRHGILYEIQHKLCVLQFEQLQCGCSTEQCDCCVGECETGGGHGGGSVDFIGQGILISRDVSVLNVFLIVVFDYKYIAIFSTVFKENLFIKTSVNE